VTVLADDVPGRVRIRVTLSTSRTTDVVGADALGDVAPAYRTAQRPARTSRGRPACSSCDL